MTTNASDEVSKPDTVRTEDMSGASTILDEIFMGEWTETGSILEFWLTDESKAKLIKMMEQKQIEILESLKQNADHMGETRNDEAYDYVDVDDINDVIACLKAVTKEDSHA